MEKNIFPRPRLDARLSALRERAKEVRDPTAADDTLQYILFTLEQLNPARILEIGAAEGLTSCAMLLNSRFVRAFHTRYPARGRRGRDSPHDRRQLRFDFFGRTEGAV